MARFGTSLAVRLAAVALLVVPCSTKAQTPAPTTSEKGEPPARVFDVGDHVRNRHLDLTPAEATQLLFHDGSTMTVGSGSDLTIDSYDYDAPTKRGTLTMTAAFGVFRLMTGHLGQEAPVLLNTPTATLKLGHGITLTTVDRDTGETETSLIVGKVTTAISKSTGESRSVTRTGYTMSVQANAPIGVTQIDPDRNTRVLAQLAPPTAHAPAGWIADAGTGCRVWNPNPKPSETVTWSGACDNGLAQGRGVLQWSRGAQSMSRYDGEMHDGKPNGTGTYVYADGKRYEGELRDGKSNGNGTLTFANGGRIEGTFCDGRFITTTTPCLRPADFDGPQPVYPEEARWQHAAGTVVLRIIVRPDGLPESISVLTSSGYSSLDEAARTAVGRWHFKTARSVTYDVPFVFRIRDPLAATVKIERIGDDESQ